MSPIYDINPTPIEIKPRVLTTAIDYDNRSASLETAMSVIKEVANAVKQWRKIAVGCGVSNSEADRMASAFEHEDLANALNI